MSALAEVLGPYDLWVGLVAGGLGVPVLIVVGFLLWERLEVWPLRGDPDPGAWNRPASEGTLLCDYVDESTLKSIGAQLGIGRGPDRIEEETRRSTGLSARTTFLGGTHSKHKGRKEIKELEADPNLLVRAVVDKLEQEGRLLRHVDAVPPLDVFEGSVTLGDPEESSQVINNWLSQQFPDGLDVTQEELARGIGRALATQLPQRQLVDAKRNEFAQLGSEPSFVLVEGEWLATASESFAVCLELKGLRSAGYDAARSSITMPEGLGVHSEVSGELTARGQRRLLPIGNCVRAGLFGEIADYRSEGGVLEITPIAIFARLGSKAAIHWSELRQC